MSLVATIDQDYLVAYKAKDSVTLGVLRLLKTALKNYQVEHRKEPDDAAVLDVIAKQCKQRQDSIAQFRAANRHDLADKEAAEERILRAYLPLPLEGEALQAAIMQAIRETNAEGVRDMGRVMQALMNAHKSRIDGKVASESVKAALQSL